MGNIKEINIKIEGENWTNALESAYKNANEKVKIDGFRKGHVPKDIFIKKYGKETLYNDAAELVLEYAYSELLIKNKDLEIVTYPDIKINSVDDNQIEFKFTLTLKPELKLGKYKGLNVKKKSVKVTKEEIEHEIERIRTNYSEEVVKEGKLENGDVAIIDFQGLKDGVAFDGGTAENYSLTIGSNTFIPGFEEQLIGMEKGEEKDINLTFPSDYHSEDLKGQDVVFKVKLNDIKTIKLPEFDEDFFADLGMEGIDSKEKLEAQIKENIKARKEYENENEYIDALLEKVYKNVEVDIPDCMIKEEQAKIEKQYEQNLEMHGLTLEQFYQLTHSDEKTLKEKIKEEAAKRITMRLMLEEIVKQEKIEIKDEDVDKEATSLAEKYQMKKDEFLKAIGGLDIIKYDLEMHAAVDIMKGE